jgi:phosphatidylserine/phosphatidylglycerophosphate/cardiolipin synthase-like enzyme
MMDDERRVRRARLMPRRFALAAGNVNLAVYTSPHSVPTDDPLPALLKILNGAKRSIVFNAYSFTEPSIAAAIIAAQVRGVIVSGVLDASEYKQKNAQGPALLAAGIDFRLWGGEYNLAHEKVAVVDNYWLVSGSYNWTTSAEKSNREIMTVVYGVQVGRKAGPLIAAQVAATYAAGRLPS